MFPISTRVNIVTSDDQPTDSVNNARRLVAGTSFVVEQTTNEGQCMGALLRGVGSDFAGTVVGVVYECGGDIRAIRVMKAGGVQAREPFGTEDGYANSLYWMREYVRAWRPPAATLPGPPAATLAVEEEGPVSDAAWVLTVAVVAWGVAVGWNWFLAAVALIGANHIYNRTDRFTTREMVMLVGLGLLLDLWISEPSANQPTISGLPYTTPPTISANPSGRLPVVSGHLPVISGNLSKALATMPTAKAVAAYVPYTSPLYAAAVDLPVLKLAVIFVSVKWDSVASCVASAMAVLWCGVVSGVAVLRDNAIEILDIHWFLIKMAYYNYIDGPKKVMVVV